LRVAAFSRSFGIDDKISETGDLDFFAPLQTGFYDVECGLDHIGGVLFRKPDLLVDSGDNFSFCHISPLRAEQQSQTSAAPFSAESFTQPFYQSLVQFIDLRIR
jgi:hypothetical protein